MVNTTATNLGRNGVSEFVIQRLSAVVLTAYTVFIAAYLATHGGLDYDTWRGLFDQLWVRVFTLLALLATAAHSWIGLWGILNDYVTDMAAVEKHILEAVERQLGDSAMRVCASPAYLDERGVPRRVAELVQHNCLGYTLSAMQGRKSWAFGRSGEHRVPAGVWERVRAHFAA